MSSNQNKKWYIQLLKKSGIFLVVMFLLVLFIAKIEELSSFIIKKKIQFFSICWNPIEIDYSQYSPLTDEKDAWYTNNRIISHACGGVDGKTYTNSKEALDLSLQNGFNLIEVDFMLTSDNHVVLRHDWGQYLEQDNISSQSIPDIDTFMNAKIHYLYNPLSLSDLIQIMDERKNLYIIVDIKGTNKEVLPVYQKMVEEVKTAGKEHLLERFIIQIYNEEHYSQVKDVYPFTNWLYTLYKNPDNDLNKVIKFCLENDIHVVTMPTGWIQTEDTLSAFKSMNIKVYTNTLNYINDWKAFQNRNVYGIYTDFLTPDDYQFVKEN